MKTLTLLLFPLILHASSHERAQQFFVDHYEAAEQLYFCDGIPVQLSLAVWALESKYGSSTAAQYNNLGGVKVYIEGKKKNKHFATKYDFYRSFAAIFQQPCYSNDLRPKTLGEYLEAMEWGCCSYHRSREYTHKIKWIIKRYKLESMKTIKELRNVLRFHPQEINSSVSYFAKHRFDGKIDFDVYLPTRAFNLQRDLVWTLRQKQEIIWSILMRRHIPRMAILYTYDNIYQVIDGKQRLSAMLDFYDNKFQLEMLDGMYYFKDLPKDYQNVIGGFYFAYNVVNEDFGNEITDSEKIEWFKFINFAGTPQEEQHLRNLSEK